MPIFPPKLRAGSTLRVVAPSCSMSTLSFVTKGFLKKAEKCFAEWGITVSYGKHVMEKDVLETSSIASRVKDLHDAFKNPSVHLIHCIRGGFSSNQLLEYLDYDLIRKHPKILCGFSDITALGNAIYAKTGLVTYSGPSFYSFGFSKGMDYTFESFARCLFTQAPMSVAASKKCVTTHWFPKQKEPMRRNPGYWIIHPGKAEGTIVGGNLCTLNLLQGTEYMPDIRGSILFLEDDYESLPHTFDRNLQAMIHLPAFKDVRGIVIGRFQSASTMSRKLLEHIIGTKKELKHLPVLANADFGHTQPMMTFPIGGHVTMDLSRQGAQIVIDKH